MRYIIIPILTFLYIYWTLKVIKFIKAPLYENELPDLGGLISSVLWVFMNTIMLLILVANYIVPLCAKYW